MFLELGFKDHYYGFHVTPIDIARKILFDKKGNFDDTYLRKKGINEKGLLYCLERLINEDKCPITYEIVKIDFSHPINQKKISCRLSFLFPQII